MTADEQNNVVSTVLVTVQKCLDPKFHEVHVRIDALKDDIHMQYPSKAYCDLRHKEVDDLKDELGKLRERVLLTAGVMTLLIPVLTAVAIHFLTQ